MKYAICINTLFTGIRELKQKHYYVYPPLADSISHIVVSAAQISNILKETYIFEADYNGNIMGFSELAGSQKNTLSHKKVLEDIGYFVIE